MGNLYAESALNPKNLQGSYEKLLKYTDDTYTAAVDDGSYDNFVHDKAGYGLAQWTYWSRKAALVTYLQSKGKSIGDLEGQLEFLVKELKENYNKTCYTPLMSAKSVKEASNIILLKYERPANQSDSVQSKRASYGQKYYDQFVAPVKEEPEKTTTGEFKFTRTLKKGMRGNDVKQLQNLLLWFNYDIGESGADGKFGNNTLAAVKAFQEDNNLVVDGIAGKKTIAALTA